jgi:hypothetical protein
MNKLKAVVLEEDQVMPFHPAFVMTLALGFKTPSEVCREFGVSGAKFKELMANSDFQALLAHFHVELQREGVLLEIHAKLTLYRNLHVMEEMANAEDANGKDKIAALEFIRSCALPKKSAELPGRGWAFSIVQNKHEPTVEVKQTSAVDEPEEVRVPPIDEDEI